MTNRRTAFFIVGIVFVAALGAVAVALPDLNRVSTGTTTATLPQGCVKPAGGVLIIASVRGFNDSVDHGVPASNWPVLNARVGQNVTIVVCNADTTQAHGFQIDHYYDGGLVSLAPGQILRVSFIASQTGTFRIFCEILCSVHWAMQNGQLTVSG